MGLGYVNNWLTNFQLKKKPPTKNMAKSAWSYSPKVMNSDNSSGEFSFCLRESYVESDKTYGKCEHSTI